MVAGGGRFEFGRAYSISVAAVPSGIRSIVLGLSCQAGTTGRSFRRSPPKATVEKFDTLAIEAGMVGSTAH